MPESSVKLDLTRDRERRNHLPSLHVFTVQVLCPAQSPPLSTSLLERNRHFLLAIIGPVLHIQQDSHLNSTLSVARKHGK